MRSGVILVANAVQLRKDVIDGSIAIVILAINDFGLRQDLPSTRGEFPSATGCRSRFARSHVARLGVTIVTSRNVSVAACAHGSARTALVDFTIAIVVYAVALLGFGQNITHAGSKLVIALTNHCSVSAGASISRAWASPITFDLLTLRASAPFIDRTVTIVIETVASFGAFFIEIAEFVLSDSAFGNEHSTST